MGGAITFRISGAAYQTIMDEAASLRPDSRTTLKEAASLPDGCWMVDSTKNVSREIEDWLRRAADATPKRDTPGSGCCKTPSGRFGMAE
jgi:hypothetical protein